MTRRCPDGPADLSSEDPDRVGREAPSPLLQQAHALLAMRRSRVETLAAALGRWRTVVIVLVGWVTWAAYNLAALHLHLPQPDPPPFLWMQRASWLGALAMAAVTLLSRRRQRARQRAWWSLFAALRTEERRRASTASRRDWN